MKQIGDFWTMVPSQSRIYLKETTSFPLFKKGDVKKNVTLKKGFYFVAKFYKEAMALTNDFEDIYHEKYKWLIPAECLRVFWR